MSNEKNAKRLKMNGGEFMNKQITKGTIIRTAVLVLAIINNLLALFNKSPLPIADETVEAVVSFLFTTGASLAAWWKNNSFTTEAITADQIMWDLKRGRRE